MADKVYKQTDVVQSSQTERTLSKVKEVQTHEPQKQDVDCLANAWLIYDAVKLPLLEESQRKEEQVYTFQLSSSDDTLVMILKIHWIRLIRKIS